MFKTALFVDKMALSSLSYVLWALLFVAAQVILSAGNQENTQSHTHTHSLCVFYYCRRIIVN